MNKHYVHACVSAYAYTVPCVRVMRSCFALTVRAIQMNVSDSEIVRAILLGAGYQAATAVEDADIVLANTCAIRENAEQKVWQRLKVFESMRRKHTRERHGLPLVGGESMITGSYTHALRFLVCSSGLYGRTT
jgi:hypothetical protein